MKIKINAKSDSCNCQGSTDSGCTNERKGEAPIDKVFAWLGFSLVIGSIVLYLFTSVDEAPPSLWANLSRVVEVLGIMCFGAAMARWRG